MRVATTAIAFQHRRSTVLITSVFPTFPLIDAPHMTVAV